MDKKVDYLKVGLGILALIGAATNGAQYAGVIEPSQKVKDQVYREYEYMLCKYRIAKDAAKTCGWQVPPRQEWREEICPQLPGEED